VVEAAERLPWWQRGCQRKAVAEALVKPMTAWEIWAQAKTKASKIQVRDVWHLLREFEAHGDVKCLSGTNGNGAVYYWTETGRKRVGQKLNRTLLPAPSEFPWSAYSFVMRGAVRRALVKEMSRPAYAFAAEVTASWLRKQVRATLPLTLNALLRTLKQLQQAGVIAATVTPRERRAYHLTKIGQRIAELLKTESFVGHAF
jgi:Fe2+ or Zn2+ uptake regulation protein